MAPAAKGARKLLTLGGTVPATFTGRYPSFPWGLGGLSLPGTQEPKSDLFHKSLVWHVKIYT